MSAWSTWLPFVFSHPLPPQMGPGLLLVEGVSGEVTGIGPDRFLRTFVEMEELLPRLVLILDVWWWPYPGTAWDACDQGAPNQNADP